MSDVYLNFTGIKVRGVVPETLTTNQQIWMLMWGLGPPNLLRRFELMLANPVGVDANLREKIEKLVMESALRAQNETLLSRSVTVFGRCPLAL